MILGEYIASFIKTPGDIADVHRQARLRIRRQGACPQACVRCKRNFGGGIGGQLFGECIIDQSTHHQYTGDFPVRQRNGREHTKGNTLGLLFLRHGNRFAAQGFSQPLEINAVAAGIRLIRAIDDNLIAVYHRQNSRAQLRVQLAQRITHGFCIAATHILCHRLIDIQIRPQRPGNRQQGFAVVFDQRFDGVGNTLGFAAVARGQHLPQYTHILNIIYPGSADRKQNQQQRNLRREGSFPHQLFFHGNHILFLQNAPALLGSRTRRKQENERHQPQDGPTHITKVRWIAFQYSAP